MNIFKNCKLADRNEIADRLVEQLQLVYGSILILLGFAGAIVSLFSLAALAFFIMSDEAMNRPFEIFLLWWGSIVWPAVGLFGIFHWAKATFCRG